MEQAYMTIDGLSRIEALELIDELPDGQAQLVEPDEDELSTEYGDVVAVAVVIAVSIVAISAMATWLASRGKNVELETEVTLPCGGGKFKLRFGSESPAERVLDELRDRGVDVPPG